MPISALLWRIETDVNLDSVMKTLRSNNPQQPVDCKRFAPLIPTMLCISPKCCADL